MCAAEPSLRATSSSSSYYYYTIIGLFELQHLQSRRKKTFPISFNFCFIRIDTANIVTIISIDILKLYMYMVEFTCFLFLWNETHVKIFFSLLGIALCLDKSATCLGSKASNEEKIYYLKFFLFILIVIAQSRLFERQPNRWRSEPAPPSMPFTLKKNWHPKRSVDRTMWRNVAPPTMRSTTPTTRYTRALSVDPASTFPYWPEYRRPRSIVDVLETDTLPIWKHSVKYVRWGGGTSNHV